MKPGEPRRTPRRSITYPAFIDLGDNAPPLECLLCDASQEGALLAVKDPTSVPDEFILALSIDGAARRRCKVAWRSKTQIGVAFTKDFKDAPVRRLEVDHRHVVPPADAPAPETVNEPADLFDIDTLAQA
jgi:hypothetical protein